MSEEEDTFEDDDMIAPEEEVVIDSGSDIDGLSLTAKEAERLRLQAEVEAFLASGGKINEIPPNLVADPPRKP